MFFSILVNCTVVELLLTMLEQRRVQVPFKTVPVVTQERGSYKTKRVVQDTVPATPSIAPPLYSLFHKHRCHSMIIICTTVLTCSQIHLRNHRYQRNPIYSLRINCPDELIEYFFGGRRISYNPSPSLRAGLLKDD